MSARDWLQSQSIAPDFEALDPGVLDYIHRRSDEKDIYFIRNRAETAFAGRAAFRVSGREPELWNPSTGELAPVWWKESQGGVTDVQLALAPGGSIFVVFSEESEFERIELLQGDVAELSVDQLQPGRRLFLDLGDVREIAEVFVNGESAGIVWKPPFRVDVTDLAKPGSNELRIEVMNLWINRLVADGELPEEERLTQTNIRVGQDWEAQPVGLLGPVQLIAAEDRLLDK